MLDRRHDFEKKMWRNPNPTKREFPLPRRSERQQEAFHTHFPLSQECIQKCHHAEYVGVAWGLVKAVCGLSDCRYSTQCCCLYGWIFVGILSCHIWTIICFVFWNNQKLEGHKNTLALTPSLPLSYTIHLALLRSAQCSFCSISLNEFVILAFCKAGWRL